MTIFWPRFNTGKNRDFFSGVQPFVSLEPSQLWLRVTVHTQQGFEESSMYPAHKYCNKTAFLSHYTVDSVMFENNKISRNINKIAYMNKWRANDLYYYMQNTISALVLELFLTCLWYANIVHPPVFKGIWYFQYSFSNLINTSRKPHVGCRLTQSSSTS